MELPPDHKGSRSLTLSGVLLLAAIAVTACSAESQPAVTTATTQPSAEPTADMVVTPTPTPTPIAADTHGLLLYDLPELHRTSLSTPVDVNLYDPQSGGLLSTHSFPASILGADLALSGYSHPDATRALSSDLQLTVAYTETSDGRKQLVAVTDEGSTIAISAAVDGSDSFSGGRTATDAFYRGDSLYFTLVKDAYDTHGTQYAVPIANVEADDLTPADYTKTNVPIAGDGISDADHDCVQSGGKFYTHSAGVLANGRSLWVESTGVGFSSATTLETLGPLTYGCGQVGLPSAKPLLPDTSKYLPQAVVSPDGETVAFIATQGADAALYTVPAAGGEPTQVMALDSKRVILAGWR